MRSCHNFTHQNYVAIYCAGFPNWLVSIIVVSSNLSVILSLERVIRQKQKPGSTTRLYFQLLLGLPLLFIMLWSCEQCFL